MANESNQPVGGPDPLGATIPIAILAGGRGSRLGGVDKALVSFRGATLLDAVLARLAGQGAPILLSANDDPARFARFGLPVIPDALADRPGPLAGLAAALGWVARYRPAAADLVSVPADTPFLPRDLVVRLVAARRDAGAEIACAESGGRLHPVIGLWPVRLAAALHRAVAEEGLRKVEAWLGRHRFVTVPFDGESPDPFFNINTAEDLRQAALVPAAPGPSAKNARQPREKGNASIP